MLLQTAVISLVLFANSAIDSLGDGAILENNLQSKAVADRESVINMMAGGSSLEEAVANFNTEDNFNNWLADFTNKLEEAAK